MKKSIALDYICRELEDLENNMKKQGGLTPGDVQKLDTFARIKKNLLKAEEMMSEDEDEYSREGSMRGSYRGSYEGGSNRGGSYEGGSNRGSYDQGGYSEQRRDRMGRYSRTEGYSRHGAEDMIEELRVMTHDLPANKRQEMEDLFERYKG